MVEIVHSFQELPYSIRKILGFNRGEYEECRLLGCDTVSLL
jgi:hypothetical protein